MFNIAEHKLSLKKDVDALLALCGKSEEGFFRLPEMLKASFASIFAEILNIHDYLEKVFKSGSKSNIDDFLDQFSNLDIKKFDVSGAIESRRADYQKVIKQLPLGKQLVAETIVTRILDNSRESLEELLRVKKDILARKQQGEYDHKCCVIL